MKNLFIISFCSMLLFGCAVIEWSQKTPDGLDPATCYEAEAKAVRGDTERKANRYFECQKYNYKSCID